MTHIKTHTSHPDLTTLQWSNEYTPHSRLYQDIYFSQQDGLAEKQYVFIEGSQLMNRFIQHKNAEFTLFETGFGTGLNYLAAWQTFCKFKQNYPKNPLQSLKFISVEASPLSLNSLQRVHQKWPILENLAIQLYRQWPTQFNRKNILSFCNQIELCLWVDDIQSLLLAPPIKRHLIVDCWFLDGFSPAKNPAMWSKELFDFMAQHSVIGSKFATYTSASFVKAQLQRVGFSLQKQRGFANKREMLTGTFQAPIGTAMP